MVSNKLSLKMIEYQCNKKIAIVTLAKQIDEINKFKIENRKDN